MSQVKLAEQATQDLGRFADFLSQAGVPHKTQDALQTILTAFERLASNPRAGKSYPLETIHPFYELVIKYGKSGYVALYAFDEEKDLVVIHAVRHQKEIGYHF